jgi:hypothetical protein
MVARELAKETDNAQDVLGGESSRRCGIPRLENLVKLATDRRPDDSVVRLAGVL